MFSRNQQVTTLENIRLRLCLDRKKTRKGDYLWSTARDAVVELRKLGFVDMSTIPWDRKQYEHAKDSEVTIAEEGLSVLQLLQADVGAAYDRLFMRMYEAHPYLRWLALTLGREYLVVPVLTSYKDHVSSHYASASVLVHDVSGGAFEVDPLLVNVAERIGRALDESEVRDIRDSVQQAVDETQAAAMAEEPSEFAKKFLLRLNDAVVPVVLRRYEMDFDYRTHRTLWQLGEDFQVWWATSSHPGYQGTLVFGTATLRTSEDRKTLHGISYPSGLATLRQTFLEKLYDAYVVHNRIGGNTYVSAWELRAVFCHENRCQPAVFNALLEEHYTGATPYRVHLEIERTRPRHEQPVTAGKRRIGTIRVTRT
jgi:hypothetical protein